jgi:hypothetical protein
MTEREDVAAEWRVGDVAYGEPVAELIERAGRLTPAEAHALAGAVAWRWQPLAPPIRGSFAATRTDALAAARAARRSEAATRAIDQAAAAALGSPGGRSIGGSWSWAENGLAAVLIGVIGAIVATNAGFVPVAIAFGVVAAVGAGVLLVVDSGRVARRRLQIGVEGAALALVVRDLVPPDTSQSLAGPWSTVIHD